MTKKSTKSTKSSSECGQDSKDLMGNLEHGTCEFFDEWPDELGHPFIDAMENIERFPMTSGIFYLVGGVVGLLLMRDVVGQSSLPADLCWFLGANILLTPVVNVVGTVVNDIEHPLDTAHSWWDDFKHLF